MCVCPCIDVYGQISFLMCSWINACLFLHVFALLRPNKTGQSTRYVVIPRYACVHVLEEMKSLQCSCHDLAAMQISSTLRRREREREKEKEQTDLTQHELKLGWN